MRLTSVSHGDCLSSTYDMIKGKKALGRDTVLSILREVPEKRTGGMQFTGEVMPGEKGKETKGRRLNKQIITKDKRNAVTLGTLGERGSWKGEPVGSELQRHTEASRGGKVIRGGLPGRDSGATVVKAQVSILTPGCFRHVTISPTAEFKSSFEPPSPGWQIIYLCPPFLSPQRCTEAPRQYRKWKLWGSGLGS